MLLNGSRYWIIFLLSVASSQECKQLIKHQRSTRNMLARFWHSSFYLSSRLFICIVLHVCKQNLLCLSRASLSLLLDFLSKWLCLMFSWCKHYLGIPVSKLSYRACKLCFLFQWAHKITRWGTISRPTCLRPDYDSYATISSMLPFIFLDEYQYNLLERLWSKCLRWRETSLLRMPTISLRQLHQGVSQ